MLTTLLSVGLDGEAINWRLVSQHSEDGDTVSKYEADSKYFNYTYHADVREGEFGRSSYYHFSRH